MDPCHEVPTDSSMNIQDSDNSDSSARCCSGTGPPNVATFNCGDGCGNGSVGEAMAGAHPRSLPASHKRRAAHPSPRCRAKRARGAASGTQDMELDQQDDDCADSMSSGRKNPPRELCWLCSFCTHLKARQLASFIESQIQHMSNLHIAEQVKDNILRDFPHALGARKRDIIRHIQFHMLSPHVRMASTLRSLFGLAESIRLSIHTQDAETDDVIIDSKQVELYMKVLNQVQSAYRMDGSRLLFMETGHAGQSSFAAGLSKPAP